MAVVVVVVVGIRGIMRSQRPFRRALFVCSLQQSHGKREAECGR